MLFVLIRKGCMHTILILNMQIRDVDAQVEFGTATQTVEQNPE